MRLQIHIRIPARFALFTLAFAAAVLGAYAQTNTNSGTVSLSLTEARDISFHRNWDLLAAKSGIDSADAQVIIAREFPNPTLTASLNKIGTHDNATAAGNSFWHRSYDTIAAVSQLVEIGGKRHDRQVAARAGLAGARARFFDAKRSLDQGVTKAYVAALLAEENAKNLKQSSGYLRREADIAGERFKAGDISDSDKKQIEIGAEQFDAQAKSAEAAATQARITVEILMGIQEPKGNWTPVDTLKLLALTPSTNAPAGSNALRPDVLAAATDLRGAKANLKLQKAMRIPDPTFAFQYEHNPNQPTPPPASDTFGVGVSFPLPLWNLNGGNIKAAKAAVDLSEIALGKIKSQAVSDGALAEVEYNEAYNRYLVYRDQTGPKSTKVRESVAFAYDKGGASLVALLDAEKTDNDIRLAVAQAMSDTASAVADLAAARAVITENELTQPNQ